MALDHAAPEAVVSLRPLGPELRDVKTHALVKTRQFEAIRLVVVAGAEIPTHSVEGMITLHCLEGAIELLGTKAVRMQPGDWLYLDEGVRHSLRGIEDSSLLLTIFLDPRVS